MIFTDNVVTDQVWKFKSIRFISFHKPYLVEYQ